ncbi:hypothetical protein [Vibrio spartinae]|uniref:Uncharacterized protein n=1 Tax=Vibrio spartinae TaxID=1918945 RepID=A0ABX6QUB7_9VIBR|nr:hypothetical protein [Vibrio spartinae]QMV12838.1 hypothetical protein Vspart_00030 [Vibrio spartinae]
MNKGRDNMTQHEDRKDREARIANQQAEYELLKQEVKEAPEIYQWQIQVGAWEGKSGRYMLNGMAIFIVLMGLLVGWGLTDKNGWTGFWIVGIWGE